MGRRIVVPLKARNPQDPVGIMKAVEDVARKKTDEQSEEIKSVEENVEPIEDFGAEAHLSFKLDAENKELDLQKLEEPPSDRMTMEDIDRRVNEIVNAREQFCKYEDIFNEAKAKSAGEAAGKISGTIVGVVDGIECTVMKLIKIVKRE